MATLPAATVTDETQPLPSVPKPTVGPDHMLTGIKPVLPGSGLPPAGLTIAQPSTPKVVPTPTAQETPVPPAAPRAAIPTPTATTLDTGATPAVPAPTEDPAIAAAAKEAADKATIKASADAATKAAEDAAAAKTAEAAAADKAKADAAAASAIAPITSTDTPVVAAQKTEAQKEFDDMVAKAKEWMNATEDPVSKLAFSRAIIQSALVNQEAMNATRAAINSNPALAGQPAGDALLALRAGQLGMQMSDLKGQLAISEARAIQELNDKGFEAVMKLNEIRKTEDEKNLSSYGKVLDNMIAGGATPEEQEAYFNQYVKPLLPDQGADMTFDMFRNKEQVLSLRNASQQSALASLRSSIAAGADLATLRQAVTAAYTEKELQDMGATALKGKTLEEVNADLKAAGYDEIESLDDLIGNEDLYGEASVINKTRTDYNRKPYEDDVDDTLDMLRAANPDFDLTPENEALVKAFVIQQSLPGADTTSVPPWQDDATSYLFKSWPSPGSNTFNWGLPDQATSPELYARNEALNTGWERYVRENPDTSKRVSRDEWYRALTAKTGDNATGGQIVTALGDFTPPKPKVGPGNITLTRQELQTGLASANDKVQYIKDNIDAAIETGIVKNFASSADMPNTKAGWDALKNSATGNESGIVKIGDSVYQIDQSGSSVVRNIPGIGDVVVLIKDGKKYVMKVNKAGSTAVEKIGYMVPVGDQGQFRFVEGGLLRNVAEI